MSITGLNKILTIKFMLPSLKWKLASSHVKPYINTNVKIFKLPFAQPGTASLAAQTVSCCLEHLGLFNDDYLNIYAFI